MKKIMTHEEIKSAFSEIYNSFYLEHRCFGDCKRNDKEWESVVEDAEKLIEKYDSTLVKTIVFALLEEFENEERSNETI